MVSHRIGHWIYLTLSLKCPRGPNWTTLCTKMCIWTTHFHLIPNYVLFSNLKWIYSWSAFFESIEVYISILFNIYVQIHRLSAFAYKSNLIFKSWSSMSHMSVFFVFFWCKVMHNINLQTSKLFLKSNLKTWLGCITLHNLYSAYPI